jgi:hypothetical protein
MSLRENGVIDDQELYTSFSLPILDTAEILRHSTGVWGEFKFDEGKIYGPHANEIPSIAREWFRACDDALRGVDIVRKMAEEHIIVLDLNAVYSLSFLTGNLGREVPTEERIKTIERSKKAFLYLVDRDLVRDLTQEDIDAAQLLVSKFMSSLNLIYEPREIKPPII